MASIGMSKSLRSSAENNSNTNGDVVVVLDFHENPKAIQLPRRFGHQRGLTMLLSSGDWVINHITNIDANPNYDIHVCLPEPASTTRNDDVEPLQANINSILTNPEFRKTKLICYVDYTNAVQMHEFCRVFGGQISQLGTLDNRILPSIDNILKLLMDGGRLIWNIAVKINANANILTKLFTPVKSIIYRGRDDYIKNKLIQPSATPPTTNKNISRKKTVNKNTNLPSKNKNSIKHVRNSEYKSANKK